MAQGLKYSIEASIEYLMPCTVPPDRGVPTWNCYLLIVIVGICNHYSNTYEEN